MAITKNILTADGNFPPELVAEMFNAVKGHSSLAKLVPEKPMAFGGATEFVFAMDSEIDVVAENGAKSEGGGTATAVKMIPVKIEYGMRASKEFITGTDEYRIAVTERFMEGFERKAGRGLDIMAIHGINPRTGSASAVIGTNNFVDKVTNTVAYNGSAPDENIDTAVGLVEEGVNGLIASPTFGQAMAGVYYGDIPAFPEFRFGQSPDSFYGMRTDVNSTVNYDEETEAIVGNFDAFRWGYADGVSFEVIKFGDPDNTGVDLAGHNQVYLRAEAYIGWGILDPSAFAIITTATSESGK